MPPMSWPSALYQLERIPRMCLRRKSAVSRECPVGCVWSGAAERLQGDLVAHALQLADQPVLVRLTAAFQGVIQLTCNEIQHLFAALVAASTATTDHRLRWSWWRRRHQARARHYRRHANRP